MGKELQLPNGQLVDLDNPSGKPPALEQLEVLKAITQNQGHIYRALQQLVNQSEIQIRILCGVDPKSLWKMRFLKADKEILLAQQAAEKEDAIDDEYPEEYQPLQEREDPDREAKRRGGYPPETAAGEEGIPE